MLDLAAAKALGFPTPRLFDEARATLEELRDEPCDPANPADACAFGALQMYRYLKDEVGEDGASEREVARILGLFAAAALLSKKE
jgi:hypothetical protein